MLRVSTRTFERNVQPFLPAVRIGRLVFYRRRDVEAARAPEETAPDRGWRVGKHVLAEYQAWKAMRSRCNNPNNVGYARYGGRGIRVCARWDDFDLFLQDMGQKPSPHHSIERVAVDGPYEPKNCRWATVAEQARNRSDNVHVEAFGRRAILTDWARHAGVHVDTLSKRLERLPPEQAVVAILEPATPDEIVRDLAPRGAPGPDGPLSADPDRFDLAAAYLRCLKRGTARIWLALDVTAEDIERDLAPRRAS